MLLDYDDNIYVCGTNNDFRLGMGLNVNLSTPTLLNSIETRSYKNYRFKKHNEIFKFNSEKNKIINDINLDDPYSDYYNNLNDFTCMNETFTIKKVMKGHNIKLACDNVI